MTKRLTYRKAGVDIDEGARFVHMIGPLAQKTARKEQIGSIGGFGALFSASFKGMKEPVLVSGTDGVGTKLLVATAVGRHDTIGIDLVAMCVNDIVVSGAEPLFFLDYLATGKLSAEKGREIVKGVVRGCREAGCALSGGETAEMPGLYKGSDYDLAGFVVGVVDRKKIIDGSSIRAGDSVIGLASSGLHSNGFSLARKVVFDHLGLDPSAKPAGFRKNIGRELLTPTRIYVKPLLALLEDFKVSGMAHITGGGMTENIPRVLPGGLTAVIKKGSWPVPRIFTFIKEGGGLDEAEMMKTFNAGIGMALVVKSRDEAGVLERLKELGERAWTIGSIEKSLDGKSRVEYC